MVKTIKKAFPGNVCVFMDGAHPDIVAISIDDLCAVLSPELARLVGNALIRSAEIAESGYSGDEIRAFGSASRGGHQG